MEDRLVAQTTHHAMGTVMAHKAFGRHAHESLEAIREEITRMEALLSRFVPGSDVCRVNGSAGIKSEPVGPETYAVLAHAVAFSRSCPGCFDVTIAPLVALWQAARQSLAEPGKRSIRQVLPLVNDRGLILDSVKRTAGLRKAGQSVDLGGIGKGWAGDRILEVFKGWGISSACSNLGGNVVTLGAKPDGSPWQIGIQHPRRENGLLGSVAVVDRTVVTSGDYQRYFVDRRGKKHHHILDPRTGYPAESGLISVSIISDQSLAADALSTMVFVAGMDRGLALLRAFPRTDAILVDANLNVYVTRGLSDSFQAARDIQAKIVD